MTALTTISITLAFFLGAAIVITMRHYYIADSLRRKNKTLKAKIESFRESENDINPVYSVRRIECSGYELFGRWAVCRTTINNGYWHASVIKVFIDEDDEFNKREAEELCEMLNS